jgi:hypothetical protein
MTPDGTLIFSCAGTSSEIELTGAHAPTTLSLLRATLPARFPIHCAKIAGCHVYWHSAVLAPLEKGADIHSLPPGSFLYYPDRQYLEITYDALQAETAAVNLLGVFKGDLGWFRAFADKHRRESGGPPVFASLELKGAKSAMCPKPPAGDTPWARLRRARIEAFEAQPDEVTALLRRDGLNIPFGPLVNAECYLRIAHETLWRLWARKSAHDDRTRAAIATETLHLAIARVAGFCHMTETGARLQDAIDCLADPALPIEEVLAETLLYCARMSGWLDLQVPWWRANELARKSLSHVRS